MSTKLWEQIQFSKAQLEGKPIAPIKYITVVDRETGLRRQVELPERVKHWWFVAENGKVCESVKYDSYTLELSKGKPSVEVASASDLIKTLETIKLALETGELDAQIDAASNTLRSGFKSK